MLLLRNKQTFLERLRHRSEVDSRCVEMLGRLRAGQAFLSTIWGELSETIDDADKDAILTAGIDKWVFLENIVRFVYDYEGCVIGEQGCDERSPALCLYCAEFQQRDLLSKKG